jgi:hypothetical protein
MSRILRRPMFRGGRVDSRGTGITSGLGYAKGGSVNDPTGTGLVGDQRYPKTDGREHHFAVIPPLLAAGSAALRFLPAIGRGYKAARYWKPGSLGAWGRTKSLMTPGKGLGARTAKSGEGAGFRVGSFAKENPLTTFGIASAIPQTGYGGFRGAKKGVEVAPDVGKSYLDLILPGDQSGWFKDEPEGPPEKEINPEMAALQKKIEERDAFIKFLEEQGKVKKSKTLSKEEKKAKIKENEEIFKEVYGSGLADDASTMALSLAGKMLKPGATVKSGFGEFFEEESKRPSERKKYKDAATTAAINAFLTGEKTLAEAEAYMDRTDYSLRKQAEYKKLANDPSSLDWTDRRTYYMTSIKGNNRDSGKVIRMSLQDEESEKGKQIFETKDTEWITNPTEAAEMDDGLYIVTPKKGPKRIFEIKEGIVIDRSSDFPL